MFRILWANLLMSSHSANVKMFECYHNPDIFIIAACNKIRFDGKKTSI